MGFLNLGRQIESLLGFDKQGLGQMRSVEWGRTYLWECNFVQSGVDNPRFTLAPTPFNDWFPAADIELNTASLESYQLEAFMSTYKIPKSTTLFDCKITFYDDKNHTLFNWINKWVNQEILNDGQYTSTLEECVKQLQVRKLDPLRDTIAVNSYWVYPETALYFTGNSSSDALQYNVNFIIVAEVANATDSQKAENIYLKRARQVLSAFI